MSNQRLKHPLTQEEFVSLGLKTRGLRDEYHSMLLIQEYDDEGGYYVYKDKLEKSYFDYIEAKVVKKDGIEGIQLMGHFKPFYEMSTYYYLDAILLDLHGIRPF
jgi:hypothetical protein